MLEGFRNRIQSFGRRNRGELRIHGGVFLVLAERGGLQVFQRRADFARRERRGYFQFAPFEQFEQPAGVLALLLGGFKKYFAYRLKALFGRGGREEAVAVARLRFPRERGKNVFLGLRSF